jgi:putative ABC transport system substrate-binding protein
MMSYGVDLMGLFHDIADYVDRIARGGKPAEMPIEQTTRFHMTVNLKIAASLNVSLSYAFTARANEVFECIGTSSSPFSAAQRHGRFRPARSSPQYP